MTRWLVTGAGGMLGRDVLRVLARDREVQAVGATRGEVDVTDAAAVRAAVAGQDVVVNTAAWTDVDGAEAHEEEAAAVNGGAVRTLAAACATTGARLVQVSTDYVFPGDGSAAYGEYAATGPVNAYGRSKLLGESAVLELLPREGYVVRTAWLYGAHGRNFVSTVLDRAAAGEPLRVVDDQHGQPTWAAALAERLVELGRVALDGQAPAGIYHGTAAGRATWYDLACAALELAGMDSDRVHRATARDYPRPAPRPAWSVLAHDRWSIAGLPPMADWKEMLSAAMTTPGRSAAAGALPGAPAIRRR